MATNKYANENTQKEVKDDEFKAPKNNIYYDNFPTRRWPRSFCTTSSNYIFDNDVDPKSWKRNIVLCGNQRVFYEIKCFKNFIKYYSLKKDFNKLNARLNLKHFHVGASVHSYLIENKCVAVLNLDRRYSSDYNVYDIENDKWLNEDGNIFMHQNMEWYGRTLLIDEKLIIISQDEYIYFYSLFNDNIKSSIN